MLFEYLFIYILLHTVTTSDKWRDMVWIFSSASLKAMELFNAVLSIVRPSVSLSVHQPIADDRFVLKSKTRSCVRILDLDNNKQIRNS